MAGDSNEVQTLLSVRSAAKRLLNSLVPDKSALIALAKKLITSLGLMRPHEGLYEILDYDLTLNIEDKEGREAVFRRRQVVRFLQDHVIAYQDEAWGDGEVVSEYHCHPGVPVDFFRVGSRRMILISLRQTKNRGDIVEFNIERRVRDGFMKAEEWLEVETRYPTDRLRIAIYFPHARPCQRARLVQRRADSSNDLGDSHFSRTSDGRQVVSWEIKKPQQDESYIIAWTW
jgi:hypothetical protein